MSAKQIVPTEISYHKKSRVLDIAFGDDGPFRLTAEFLRVHSPSAEVRGHGPGQDVLQIGKEDVGIDRIEPVGNYAVRLYFDDGHDTGLYSWQELQRFCSHNEELWADYLSRLAAAGHLRKSTSS
ncbi:MAG: DUF971 domain-containing protein [Gammaproteobacteria bacterium]|jgi:DUF971 family protein|nr:DUF971 domain-containing protein [Gammaproteobacteria bacterium]NCF81825.1 DUF971 domain-containing protein [Pseudomonadota bacterium]